MILVKGLNKRFGKLPVLKDVAMVCDPGACIALVGPNGSGKTTLMKTILGMVIPDSGEVSVNGTNIEKDWKYRSAIGYMPQITKYPDNMTVGQIMDMMGDLRRNERKRDEELIERFHLKDIYHKRMRSLSGGMRQKVGACLALLFDPEIIILDEPTAGLDPVSSEILKEKLIREKAKGKVTVISTHILTDLDDLVTEIIFMQEGRVLFQKNLRQLTEETGETKISKMILKIIG